MPTRFFALAALALSTLAACGAPSSTDASTESAAVTDDAVDGGSVNGTRDGGVYGDDDNVLTCWLSYGSADGNTEVIAAQGSMRISTLIAQGATNGALVVADATGPYALAVSWEGAITDYLPVLTYLYGTTSDTEAASLPVAWLPSLKTPVKNALVQLSGVMPTPLEQTDGDGGTQTFAYVYGNCSINPPESAASAVRPKLLAAARAVHH